MSEAQIANGTTPLRLEPEEYELEQYINGLRLQVQGLQEYVLAFQAIAMQATGKSRETLEHEARQIIRWVRDHPNQNGTRG